MIGQHLIKSWSSTQASVSLSSGEAEFYGVVRAAGVALGQQSLMADLGYTLPVRVWTDSSAAMGICQRTGLGKLRHIATQGLWIQQHVREKRIELRKVKGEVNPADLFTKHLLSRETIDNLMKIFGCEYRDGRLDNAPLLRRDDHNLESPPPTTTTTTPSTMFVLLRSLTMTTGSTCRKPSCMTLVFCHTCTPCRSPST